MSESKAETAQMPTRIASTCDDCGTTVTLAHPDGIGGAELAWPCPVCHNPLAMSTPPGVSGGAA